MREVGLTPDQSLKCVKYETNPCIGVTFSESVENQTGGTLNFEAESIEKPNPKKLNFPRNIAGGRPLDDAFDEKFSAGREKLFCIFQRSWFDHPSDAQ